MVMKYTGHGRNEKFIQILSENLTGRDHLEDLGVDGRIIFKWMLKR
jgi:hypothetical protein